MYSAVKFLSPKQERWEELGKGPTDRQLYEHNWFIMLDCTCEPRARVLTHENPNSNQDAIPGVIE